MLDISPTSHEAFKKLLKVQEKPGEIEEKLLKRVYRFVPFLGYIPGFLLIGVGNSISMNACHKDSDIDLFVITKKNRIWTVRILMTLYFQVLGLRKTSKNHAGKFCLSFFVTQDATDFKDISIKNDIYLYHRILYMKPIVDKYGTYEAFIQANSSWCDFSRRQDIISDNKKYIRYTTQKKTFSFGLLKSLGDIIESICKSLFLPRTKKSFQNLGKPFGVIISNDVLKFHDNDRREEISEYIPEEVL